MTQSETKEQIDRLFKLVKERFPNAQPIDFEKLTPTGVQIRQVFRDTAKQLGVDTNDKTWMAIGRSYSPALFTAKPASPFETK